MLGLGIFFNLLIIFFAVLNLILFFKIWGMTNNTKRIRILLENYFEEQKKKDERSRKEQNTKFKVGEEVILKENGSKMIVDYVREGKYYLRGGFTSYNEDDLEKVK